MTPVHAVGFRWDPSPVETLARAAARDAWAEQGTRVDCEPTLPAWLALERLVADVQLDGASVAPGDRVSALTEALLAKRDAWDELARAARSEFVRAFRVELTELAGGAR